MLARDGRAPASAFPALHPGLPVAFAIGLATAAALALHLPADVALVTRAGPEVAVPATKTYVAQLVAIAEFVDHLPGLAGEP